MVQEFIGQSKAKQLIQEWKSRNSFPHFMLIVGEEGSGRKTISRHISKELNCHLELRPDLSASSIRQLIDIAYRTMSRILYVIPNADTMSIQAKNLFLKFTEEPPENTYIILTLNSLDNILPTLISRSQQIVLEPYTRQELAELTENKKYASIATTPGMLQYFEELGEDTVGNIVDFESFSHTKRNLAGDDSPSNIKLYAKNFESKEAIKAHIDNQEKTVIQMISDRKRK